MKKTCTILTNDSSWLLSEFVVFLLLSSKKRRGRGRGRGRGGWWRGVGAHVVI